MDKIIFNIFYDTKIIVLMGSKTNQKLVIKFDYFY